MVLDHKRDKQQDAERKRIEAFVDRFRAKATQGAPGAVAPQAARQAGADRRDGRRRGARDRHSRRRRSRCRRRSSPSTTWRSATTTSRCCGGFNLRIDDDDRIALIGANGNGKSTFAKLLAGRMEPMGGRITRADKLDVAYFAQHQLDELKRQRKPVRSPPRADAGRARGQGARAASARSGSPAAQADAQVATLSGGEKARLLLGLATFAGRIS